MTDDKFELNNATNWRRNFYQTEDDNQQYEWKNCSLSRLDIFYLKNGLLDFCKINIMFVVKSHPTKCRTFWTRVSGVTHRFYNLRSNNNRCLHTDITHELKATTSRVWRTHKWRPTTNSFENKNVQLLIWRSMAFNSLLIALATMHEAISVFPFRNCPKTFEHFIDDDRVFYHAKHELKQRPQNSTALSVVRTKWYLPNDGRGGVLVPTVP